MSEHETVRELLALASAGALNPQETSLVQRHARACEACRRNLEIWSLYTQGLGQLPQPSVPLGLVERTRMRMLEEHAAAAERRATALTLAMLSVFCWASFLLVWILVRTVTGGVWNVFGMNLASLPVWSLISVLLNWITAGAAAVMLGDRGKVGRIYEPLS